MGSAGEMEESGKKSKLWGTAMEVSDPETVSVEGQIPRWLIGGYYRVGPGKFDFQNYTVTHWLDGYAIVTSFEIDGRHQEVTLRSKFVKSETYQKAIKGQRPAVAEFASPADTKKGFFGFIPQIVPETTDNTNHALFTFDPKATASSQLFTVNGAGVMNSIDPVTLDCLGPIDPSHFGVNMCTAHPLTDSRTGVTYNVGFSLVLTGLKYNVVEIPRMNPSKEVKGQLKQSRTICSIPTQWTTSLSFLHSFGMTPNFIIFVEQPLVINLSKMLNSSVRGKSEAFKDWLEWRDDAENRFYIIEKSSGRLVNKSQRIVSSELFFFFHVINCYEDIEQNELVIDLSTYENGEVMLGNTNLLEHVRNPARFECHSDDELLERSPRTKRFQIPLSRLGVDLRNLGNLGSKATNEVVTIVPSSIIPHGGLELATINRSRVGLPYRFYYASGLLTQGEYRNSLCKIDVVTGQVRLYRGSDTYIFGEPVFVPEFPEGEEDEGVLIVPMTDLRHDKPDILFFIDSKNMNEIGRAVFRNWIPSAIHGIYISK